MIELDKGAQDCINTILRNRGIAEVKVERNSVVVVDIGRKVKYKSDGDADKEPIQALQMNVVVDE